MSFAFKVHAEQHIMVVRGCEYLIDIQTTRFLGYTLITKVRCCQPTPIDNNTFSHIENRDFSMTLQTDHDGKLDDNTVNTHIEAVKQNLSSIFNSAKAFYAY